MRVNINGVAIEVEFNDDGTVNINGTTVAPKEEPPVVYGYDTAPYLQIRGDTRKRYFRRVPGTSGLRGCEFLLDQDLWVAIMGSNPSHFQDMPFLPGECISLLDAEEFVRRLNQYLPEGLRLRLPTEDDYEAMLDDEQRKNLPPNPNEVVCFDTPGPADKPNRKGTRPCDWSKPNKYGFHDLVGNLANVTTTPYSPR